MGKLAGRVAIVTGGARGLGAAAARALVAEGAAVMITDVLDVEGESTRAELSAIGGPVHYTHHDVRKAEDWDRIVKATVDVLGEVNILVNNAGILIPVSIEDGSLDDFQAIIDVNLIGAFLGMKAVFTSMRRAGHGSIVNIASNTTQMILPSSSLYGAAKAALSNLTKTTAVHLARSGDDIRVNSVHPGAMVTHMTGNGDPAVLASPLFRSLVNAIPMGRMGTPAETGTVVAFLASDEASYITASEIFVDGGLSVVSFGESNGDLLTAEYHKRC